MLRVLFLILVLMSSIIFAQTVEKPKQNEMPKVSKTVEFGQVSNGNIRYLMDRFLAEIYDNATVQGYIISYGKTREVVRREKILRSHINFRVFDVSRITFVRGSNKKEFVTEFWFVPQGAKPPTP